MSSIVASVFELWSSPAQHSDPQTVESAATFQLTGRGERFIDVTGLIALSWLHGAPVLGQHIESQQDFWRPFFLQVYAGFPSDIASSSTARAFEQVLHRQADKLHAPVLRPRQEGFHGGDQATDEQLAHFMEDLLHKLPPKGMLTRFGRSEAVAYTEQPESLLAQVLQMFCATAPATAASDFLPAVVAFVRRTVQHFFPWVLQCTVSVPVSALCGAFDVCARCTKLRVGAPSGLMNAARAATQNIAGILSACITRKRPSNEDGLTWEDVRCCDHLQWRWCPGFGVTGNEKCRNTAHRHEACPRYFARSTMWKHTTHAALPSKATAARSKPASARRGKKRSWEGDGSKGATTYGSSPSTDSGASRGPSPIPVYSIMVGSLSGALSGTTPPVDLTQATGQTLNSGDVRDDAVTQQISSYP
jgi:hypothetical protein